VVRTFEWIRSYSLRLGLAQMTEFKSGIAASAFDSPQNPFLTGALVMEQQGCWMGGLIENIGPARNRWGRFLREEPEMIAAGITDRDQRWQHFEQEINAELQALSPEQREAALQQKIAEESTLSTEARRANYQWGAAPFRRPWQG